MLRSLQIAFLGLTIGVCATLIGRGSEVVNMPAWAWSVWLGCLVATAIFALVLKQPLLLAGHFVGLPMFLFVGFFDLSQDAEVALPHLLQAVMALQRPMGWIALVALPLLGFAMAFSLYLVERDKRTAVGAF
ncbi:hypothetical protein LJR290_007475 [Variovorax sp. LjRoot290]|uniref:hypothetical protein n=1 Tax=Variovorax sp. LjRoot290 TaxID=3342316 RepID=UPI003ECC82FD